MSAARLTPSPGDRPDEVTLAIYGAAGEGVFAGVLVALASHWAWGLTLWLWAFIYGFSLARLQGWPELAAVTAMIGTSVAYFGVLEVIEIQGLGRTPTIVWCVLVIAAFVVGEVFVCGRLGRAARSSPHWGERWFARLRADMAAGRPARPNRVRTLLWLLVSVAVFLTIDNRALVCAIFGVAFLEFLLLMRSVQYARRLQQPKAEMAIGTGKSRPILFLRPFELDALLVSPIGRGWRALLAPSVDKPTFEEQLAATFADLGPVIAVGRPGELVAELGAAREYADEESWRQLVLRRAAAAQFVIMEVDASRGMIWELEHVPDAVGLERVLIVLPPGEYDARPAAFYERWAALREHLAWIPDVSDDAVAVLFDEDGGAIIVPRPKGPVVGALQAVRAAWVQQHGDHSAWGPAPGGGTDLSAPSMVERGQRKALINRRAQLAGLAARRTVRHGRNDLERLRLRGEVATTLVALGELTKARRIQEEVVERIRQVKGEADSQTLVARRELADTLRRLGDLASARAALEQVAATSVVAHGQDDDGTLAAQVALALVMRDQGDVVSARSLLDRALASRQDREADVVRAAEALLASLLTLSGDYEAARDVLTRHLTATRRRFGNGHSETIATMNLLAEALTGLGQRGEAAQMSREALAASELGDEHPLTVKLLLAAARHSAAAGQLDVGRALAERAVATTTVAFGDNHPDTLTALSMLGWARWHQGELEPARELFALTWDGRRRILGEAHHDTLAVLTNLASVELALGHAEAALAKLTLAASTYERVYGTEHPHTMVAQSALARAIADSGDLAGARDLHERVVARALRRLGPEHPDTAGMTVALAQTLVEQGETERARRLVENALETLTAALGHDHPLTAAARSDLQTMGS